MYQGSFEIMQNNMQFENILLFQVHQVLLKSKIWNLAEELTSLTWQVSIQFILLQRQKMEKDI